MMGNEGTGPYIFNLGNGWRSMFRFTP